MSSGFMPVHSRDRCANATNRRACGDGELIRLRATLRRKEQAYMCLQEAENSMQLTSELASALCFEMNRGIEGNLQVAGLTRKVEKLEVKLSRCTFESYASESDAKKLNEQLLKANLKRAGLVAELQRIDDVADTYQKKYDQAAAKTIAAHDSYQSAKVEHDEYFIVHAKVPQALLDKVIVVITRTGLTEVRSRDSCLPELVVSFRSDGSIIPSTANSFVRYWTNESGAAAD